MGKKSVTAEASDSGSLSVKVLEVKNNIIIIIIIIHLFIIKRVPGKFMNRIMQSVFFPVSYAVLILWI